MEYVLIVMAVGMVLYAVYEWLSFLVWEKRHEERRQKFMESYKNGNDNKWLMELAYWHSCDNKEDFHKMENRVYREIKIAEMKTPNDTRTTKTKGEG